MAFLTDPEFWFRWWSIVLIDLTLAGDNALVIALAVRTLPKRQQFWGRMWGTGGAVALRLLFIAIIAYLLRIPFLQLAGGLLLIWIALKLIRQETGAEGAVRQGTTLLDAVWIIILADIVMSLDNVLAVAVASGGDLVLVIFGIGLSIPIVVWGSGILAALMGRFGWIVWIGGGVLGFFAGEIILKDPTVHRFLGDEVARTLHYPLPITLGVIITILGWWFAQEHRRQRK